MRGGQRFWLGRHPWDEAIVYLLHVCALFWPGFKVPVFRVDAIDPGSMSEWSDGESQLLIDEGRRQIDRQLQDLEQIRSRSAFLVTTSFGALTAWIATLARVNDHPSNPELGVLAGAAFLLVFGLLGSGALLTARSEFGLSHAAILSNEPPPIAEALAKSYAELVSVGENTVATRTTVFRDAMMLITVGAILVGTAWLWTL